MSELFQRERRYTVLKISDIEKYLTGEDLEKLLNIESWISFCRQQEGKRAFSPVVVEDNWPEYEPVWQMIEARVSRVDTEKRIKQLESCIYTSMNGLLWYKDAHQESWSEADEEHLQELKKTLGSQELEKQS